MQARASHRSPIAGMVLLAGCGARSSLSNGDGDGGATSSASSASLAASTTVSGTGGGAPCHLDDLSTWSVERYRDFGDYERAAVATSGVPWVALKRKNGNIVVEELGV